MFLKKTIPRNLRFRLRNGIKLSDHFLEWERLIVENFTITFIVLTLAIANVMSRGNIAKVDFMSDFSSRSPSFGWSSDNFGQAIGLGSGVEIYQDLMSLLPNFIYKDLIVYFIFPISLAYYGINTFAKNSYKQHGKICANLIACYTTNFFFMSSCFASVYFYGWNLLLLLPVAGLTLACFGIDRFYESSDEKYLIVIGIGMFLIGGMLQFWVVPLFWMIRQGPSLRQKLLCVLAVIAGSSLSVFSEVFKNLFLNSEYYLGVDAVMETKTIQELTSFTSRIVGVFDPVVIPHWNNRPWIVLFVASVLSLAGFRKFPFRNYGSIIIIVFYFLLNFTGHYWDWSLNKAWIYLPALGGIYRNPDKIFAILAIFIFLFASSWLSSKPLFRWALGLSIFISSLNFYISSAVRPLSEVAEVSPPLAYSQLADNIRDSSQFERILLLPFPQWFHRYSWTGEKQTRNVLREVLSQPVVSDEMNPPRNLPKQFGQLVSSIPNENCRDSIAIAKELGITKIVLQLDISTDLASSLRLKSRLEECYGNPKFKSEYLLMYDVTNSPGIIHFDDWDKYPRNNQIEANLLGYKICNEFNQSSVLTLREFGPGRNFLMLKMWGGLEHTNGNENTWKSWKVSPYSCYQLLNVTRLLRFVLLAFSLVVFGMFFSFALMKRKKNTRSL